MIVSHRGGIPEQALDAALYFSPPDTTAFSNHLIDLLDHPARRAALAAQARARALALQWSARHADLLKAVANP